MIADRIAAGELEVLDDETLLGFIRAQRWFGSKAQDVTQARVLDAVAVRTQAPLLVLALVEVRFGAGTHDLYQVLLGMRRAEDGWEDEAIGEVEGWTVYDGLADPVLTNELVSLMRAETTVRSGDEGELEFRAIDLAGFAADLTAPRPVGAEQSNTSVVFGDALIMKSYRRLEAGINPELELLRFLTQRKFPHVAALAGWYAYSGRLLTATLGILQEFVPDAEDGWDLALRELAEEPEGFLGRLRRLGEVTGALHTALASDTSDPDFAPEEPSAESLALLTATVDEEIETMFLDLPDDPRLEPIVGRGEEVRDRLRLISHVGAAGKLIRHHGDYHLGQVLWNGEDWVVLDFEGEPARTLPERRQKRSPLRDVAGMLRSFAYAASGLEILRGGRAPEGWEERARTQFLEGYFETVDRSIVPPGQEARERLLSVFELEKAVYELRYELNNRPDWVAIPVAGIVRILEEGE